MRRLSPKYNHLVGFVRKAYHSLLFPALIVFGVILLVAIWASRAADAALQRNISVGMDAQAGVVQRTVSVGLQDHEQYLRGLAAFFASSVEVTDTEWNTYVNSSAQNNQFSAGKMLGVAAAIDGKFVVTHTAQGDGIPAVGSDLLALPQYRQLVQATETSRQIVLLPDRLDGSALLLGIPFYVGGVSPTQAQLESTPMDGVIYTRIDAQEFFSRAMDDALLRGTRIRVYAGTASSPLYASPNFNGNTQTASLQKTYYYYGQPLRVDLEFDVLSLVSKTQLDGPVLIISGGILAALLIASSVYLLLMTRARQLQNEKVNDLNLAKDDLLSLASHQLRTPATGVKQYLGMVLQGFAGDVSDKQRMLLEKAFASNDRQLSVINEVLHVAKIGAGRIVLAKHNMNLSDLIQDVVNEQLVEIKQAKHTITTQLPVRPVILHADSHMLRMAIENILSNAIKYTPPGGSIHVSLTVTQLYAKIAIKDNGVGINPEDIKKLFQQFTRLTNEMGYHVSGTGVGLYLAKHLVELHGGKVTVSSAPKKGSLFVISLPRRKTILSATKKV